MARVFLIHGWGGYPHKDFFPWATKELEAKGYDVIAPTMPDSLHPKIEVWIPCLTEIVGEIRPDDIFIGHSIGCQTILRYLETLKEGQKVDKVILVAPWGAFLTEKAYEDEEDKVTAKPWLKAPINFQKIKSKADSFVAIFSDDDPLVPFEESSREFKEKLGVEIVVEHKKGHFTEDDGVKELPELLKHL